MVSQDMYTSMRTQNFIYNYKSSYPPSPRLPPHTHNSRGQHKSKKNKKINRNKTRRQLSLKFYTKNTDVISDYELKLEVKVSHTLAGLGEGDT